VCMLGLLTRHEIPEPDPKPELRRRKNQLGVCGDMVYACL
jgi:hypothetical protein